MKDPFKAPDLSRTGKELFDDMAKAMPLENIPVEVVTTEVIDLMTDEEFVRGILQSDHPLARARKLLREYNRHQSRSPIEMRKFEMKLCIAIHRVLSGRAG